VTAWKRVPLGAFAKSVEYGVTAAATLQPVGPKFLRITDIQDGAVNWDTVPWCKCDARSVEDSRLLAGDIVFARTGATTGKSFLIRDCPPDTVFASYLIRVRVGNDADPRYVSHFFQTRDYWAQITKGARGAAQPGVNATTLKAIHVPLPPVAEQKRIAEVMDRAEALRAKRRAALTQLDTLTQSMFLDLFGDADAKGWPMTTVAEIAKPDNGSIRTGPFGSQLLHSEFVDEGVAVLGIDNAVANEFRWGERRFISEAKYRELKRYTVRPGDVLITIMGTCGRCAVVPDDVPLAINTKHLCCITLDRGKCVPVFLHAYFLRHPLARRYLDQTAKGAIMSGLNMGIIEAMPIPIPPIELQHKFARQLAAVEKLKNGYRVSLAEMDTLFAALQHGAFRGEL
jgi:type I restriction enzyme S subunit